jgi:hypothetical protein
MWDGICRGIEKKGIGLESFGFWLRKRWIDPRGGVRRFQGGRLWGE